ncbi:MAG TPA: ferritin-like domain-containing protein, partial [Nannocystaceae bacterium]|nr:ferritin-like domain-containing protein [Nannocystaceae bacterium]
MVEVGRLRTVAVILSALGVSACTSPITVSSEGNAEGDEAPTSGDESPTGPDSYPDDGADGGSCYTDTHDELVCLDPEGGSTGSVTFGAVESSSESGGTSSSGSETSGSETTGSETSGSSSGDASTGSSSESDSSTSGGGGTCQSPEDVREANPCAEGWALDVEGPAMKNGQCCYTVTCEATSCSSGRPFVVDEAARVAAVRRRDDWYDAARIDVRALDAATRAELAAAWLADAQAEHASVASFARFALELLSIGAPPELVADAHAAARDEIEHAKICFALASAYAGVPQGPGPLAVDGSLARCGDLYAIIRATVEEGCVGETLAALEAEAAVARATDPVVRAALTRIAGDEARHAALAWRVVAWALGSGAPSVRRAVLDGLAAGERTIAPRIAATPIADGEGRLGRDRRNTWVRSAWTEVLAP